VPDQTIKCPTCGAEIPLTEALYGQIEQVIKAKYDADAAVKDKEYQAKLKGIQLQAKELEAKQQTIDEQVEQQVKLRQKAIAEIERKKILAEQAEQTKALEEELEEKSKKLSDMQKQEIDLRKKQRELEQKQQELELENQRKLDQEIKKISDEASKKAAEENMLKMREKDDQLAIMKKQIDELKRKTEVGSQEAQGEALEEELKEYLERTFPYDKFDEVKKGTRGADILQLVHNTSGTECGRILWESKNTKDFQKTWIPKLKKDQQEAKADLAVIMSVALPDDIDGFDMYDAVWVTDYRSLKGLAKALRQQLVETKRQKVIAVGRDSMKDVVYNYITSKEFALHIKAVANAYKQMQEDLETEKRAMTRIWKKREKQISAILDNVTGIYGSIEGIVGSQKTLPKLESMSLEAIADDDEVID